MPPIPAAAPLPSGRPQQARSGDPISHTGRLVIAGVGSHQRLLSPRASSADLWSSIETATTADGVKRLRKLRGQSVDKASERRLAAYIHQARQYYDVVASLDPATKPLPGYYFVLNLAKAYLTLVNPTVTSTPKVAHGASDATELGQRYRFTQEYAKVSKEGVFRLLANRTGQGFCWQAGEKIKIDSLAAYLVEGADLYGDALGRKPKLVPIERTTARCSGNGGARQAWLTVDISRSVLRERDLSARGLLTQAAWFGERFQLVSDDTDDGTYTYESITPIAFSRTRAVLEDLRTAFDESLILRDRTMRAGADHVVLSSRQQLLSMEAVTFLLIHHLSNMVRYRPQQVEALRGGKHWWLFTSWVDRACENFLLAMASRISLEEHVIN